MRFRDSRTIRLLLWGGAAAHVVHGLVLRHRRSAIAALPAAEPDLATDQGDQPTVFCLRGTDVDDETRAAAMHEMRAAGVTAIDLVPGDLPAEPALRLLNRVDPHQLVDNPLQAPGGACHAVVVHPTVAIRMGVAGTVEVADRAELLRLTRRVERYAPTTTVLRLAPRVRAAPDDAESRWDQLEEQTADVKPFAAPAPVVPAGKLLQLVALAGGVVVAPVAGTAALLAWTTKPVVVWGGALGQCLTRPVRTGLDALADLRVGLTQRQAAAQARRDRVPPPPPPTEELFDPRRDTCPWCGSDELVRRLETRDLMQHKPGEFHMDECQACGHVFQNPALSLRGLDYFYDQFYDGVGAESSEGGFANMLGSNQGRVDAVARFHEPRAWLDVGAGIGQFCVLARQRWPKARFDGLDMSESVEEAQRRGWVDTAYRGLFPDLADGLPRSYDVVSMHHYLEHTRDPRAELTAASKVVEPGGYLMIEVPDTASPWSRRLGRFWNCWFQPQHQHFVTCDNLVGAVQEAGFDVLSVERGSASTGGDLIMAPMLAASSVAPSPYFPWLAEPSPADQLKRVVAGIAGLTAAALLFPIELAKEAYLHGPGAAKPSNAFRIVARRS